MTLEQTLEAILFFKSEPLLVAKLAEMASTKEELVREGLEQLAQNLTGRGVTLIFKDDSVMLGTAPEASVLIEKMIKEELSRELGKAGLETLAIVLYEGPVSRAEIDYIRGVNSSFILRHMLVRGLVERVNKPGDARAFLYRPSFDLLRHLGVAKIEDLPDFAIVKQELATFRSENAGDPEAQLSKTNETN